MLEAMNGMNGVRIRKEDEESVTDGPAANAETESRATGACEKIVVPRPPSPAKRFGK